MLTGDGYRQSEIMTHLHSALKQEGATPALRMSGLLHAYRGCNERADRLWQAYLVASEEQSGDEEFLTEEHRKAGWLARSIYDTIINYHSTCNLKTASAVLVKLLEESWSQDEREERILTFIDLPLRNSQWEKYHKDNGDRCWDIRRKLWGTQEDTE